MLMMARFRRDAWNRFTPSSPSCYTRYGGAGHVVCLPPDRRPPFTCTLPGPLFPAPSRFAAWPWMGRRAVFRLCGPEVLKIMHAPGQHLRTLLSWHLNSQRLSRPCRTHQTGLGRDQIVGPRTLSKFIDAVTIY